LPTRPSPVSKPAKGAAGTPAASLGIYCGVDNGSSGSIAILTPGAPPFWAATPTKRCRNYQKTEKHLNRVDAEELFDILHDRVYVPAKEQGLKALVLLERPYCNPAGFNASMLAARALDATLVVLDLLQLDYRFVDSKEWQSVMLPKGIIGRDELKKASYDVGKKRFPATKFKKDADSLLMAQWAQEAKL
jgi:hypothetical protein